MWTSRDQRPQRPPPPRSAPPMSPPPRPARPAWMERSSARRRALRRHSGFESLRDDCVASGRMYQDPDFRAANSSLYFDRQPAWPITWMRPSEMVDDPQMFVEGASRFDVQQGELGNCWFLASLAALCGAHGSSPSALSDLVQRVVPSDNKLGPEGGGVVHFRIWHFGEWKEVIVDNRLPTVRGKLLYVHSSDKNEFWSALLEKAYAKLYGSYQVLDGGLADEGLVDLTGGIVETFELSQSEDTLWAILWRAHRRTSLMVCNIVPPSGWDGEVLPTGLLPSHAYTVTSLRMLQIRGRTERLLRIRNPWGTMEWNGRWSDTCYRSRSLPEEEREAMGMLLREDGEFWMCWEDFRVHYSRLQLCHLSPTSMPSDSAETGATWASSQHRGVWRKFVSAGGCANHPATFWTNPQFRAEVVDPDEDDDEDLGTLIVALMQIGGRRRRKEGAHFFTIGLSIFKLDFPRQGLLGRDFFQSHRPVVSSKYANIREVCDRFKLAPGHYVIVPSTFLPNEEADFLLRIFSERPHEAAEMDEEAEDESEDNTVNGQDNQKEVSPAPDAGGSDSDEAAQIPEGVRQQVRSVWQHFKETAGADWQVDAHELKTFLNSQFIQDLGFSRFKMDTCRSMVAMMDENLSGKLGYQEFRDLWEALSKWQEVFRKHDADKSGTFNSYELRLALHATGYRVSNRTFLLLVARYSQPDGNIFFNDFVHCAVRLTTMTATFKRMFGDANPPSSRVHMDQFLQATMYS